jgi:RNA polymerase sigma-70 factor (ECF subfamily)
MDEADDRSVVKAVLQGKKEAFAVLVQRYQKPMYNLMFRSTRSAEDAADLAQEAFIRAYQKLDRFDPEKKFFPWLYTIGLNLARDFGRRKRGTGQWLPLRDTDQMEADPPAELEELDRRRMIDQVQAALMELSVEDREALMLRYHHERSMTELAEIFSVSLSGAKMRVHRALKRLKDVLGRGES